MVGNSGMAVEVDAITKTYGRHAVVKGLSFSVAQGTVFGLLGPNGAGKTTTIRMLMGLTQPSSGEICILGHSDVGRRKRVRANVGYVPERPCIYPWMRVREVVGFARAFYPDWDSRFCEDLTRRLKLEPDKKVRHLSKGTLAKLSLLLALAHRPRVLLLDEPTTGLDPIVRQEFLDDVRGLVQSEGMTVLFSSHIISDVERMADTVGILHEGELPLVASLDQLLSSTKRLRVLLREPRVPLELPVGTLWHRLTDRTWSLTVADCDDSTLEFVTSRHAVDDIDVIDMNLEAVFYDTIKGRTASRASTTLERH